jgi:Rrf2 family protein
LSDWQSNRNSWLFATDMRVSKKTDYALRVLFTLADRHGRGPISMQELAALNDVPKRFLEHIMLDLKKMGWVASTLGRHGGYLLAKVPEEITMGQVVRCFERPLAPVACEPVAKTGPRCQPSASRFRRVFVEIREMASKYLDNVTLANVNGKESAPNRDA